MEESLEIDVLDLIKVEGANTKQKRYPTFALGNSNSCKKAKPIREENH